MSKKFEKELLQFCAYATDLGYTVVDKKTLDKVNLNPCILEDFIEPPRNKLNKFLSDLLELYSVRIDQKELEQWYVKTIIKEFKLNQSTSKQCPKDPCTPRRKSRNSEPRNSEPRKSEPRVNEPGDYTCKPESPKTKQVFGFNIVKGSLVKVHMETDTLADIVVRADAVDTFMELFYARTREITIDEINF